MPTRLFVLRGKDSGNEYYCLTAEHKVHLARANPASLGIGIAYWQDDIKQRYGTTDFSYELPSDFPETISVYGLSLTVSPLNEEQQKQIKEGMDYYFNIANEGHVVFGLSSRIAIEKRTEKRKN